MRGENKIDLVGQRFGRLLVESPAESRRSRAYWNCICDCGESCQSMGKYLRQGKKQSCGCLQRESSRQNAIAMVASNNLPPGVAAFNLLFASYRCSAEARAIDFNLSKDSFRDLTRGYCFYCGKEPATMYAADLPNGGYEYNGVDRKDSNVGYVLDNCVSCCKACNWMKNVSSVEDYISQCAAVTDYQRSKNQ